MSLRKAINEKCKDCIYDDLAAGSWLQQVTICSSKSCPLYEVRPKSKSAMPKSVLVYYDIKSGTSQGLKSIPDNEVAQSVESSKDLVDELSILAIKCHTPEILNDIPIMNESELMGALNYLRRIDIDRDT